MLHNSYLHGLYVITDHELCRQRGLVASVEAALHGGARIVQYRDKSSDHERRLHEARALVALCNRHDALLFVNDDVPLAQACNAHGAHLGRKDTAINKARALLGRHALIGVSCYDDFALAQRAADAGADYVAFGSVFPSKIKPGAVRAPLELLARARQQLRVPVCAIGGIDRKNIGEIAAAGAAMAAVISAVFAAPDIGSATRELNRAFHNHA